MTATASPAQRPEPLGADLLARLGAAAASVPEVTEAVAVVRRHAQRAVVPRQPAAIPPRPPAPEVDTESPINTPSSVDSDKPPALASGRDLTVDQDRPPTLQSALLRAADRFGDRGTVYIGPDGSEDFQSYRTLLTEAQRVLGGLRAAGLRPGDPALFQFDDNRNYVTTFWACVLGGFLPTPVAVAPTYEQHNAVTRKLYNAWKLLDRPTLLTDRATFPKVTGLARLWDEPDVRVLAAEELAESAPDTAPTPVSPHDPVLHLLTSGSTGVPKCVQHTNASVAARTYAAAQLQGYGPDDVTVNWMPLDHVAIAMYNVRDVFLGCQHVNAKINTFLANPLRWLDWIDRHRGTNTWAPNFAYAMLTERAEEIAAARWDLSCMRAMTNAAEPIIARTAHRVLDLLAPHGLPADAMKPCWGMSETCSGVTYTQLDRNDHEAGTLAVRKESLGGDLIEADRDDPDAVVFTDVGRPVPGFSMRIVDEQGAVLPEDRIGELQVTGDVMMRGYHGNPEATAASSTGDGWFRTGDLAFLHEGSLVITGRQKDQIIVRGVNYLAHELEAAVEAVDGVEVTFVAAGAVPDGESGSDRLALFFVPTNEDPATVAAVVSAIRARLVRDVGIAADFIVPVSRQEFPKTGSGKIQRGQLVAELRAGTFDDRTGVGEPADESASGGLPSWFFEPVWTPAESVTAQPAEADGAWLVFDDSEWWPKQLSANVVSVRRGTHFKADGDDSFRIAAGEPEQVGQVLAAVRERYGRLAGIVYGWDLATSGEPTGADVTARTLALLPVIRELSAHGRPPLLVCTTSALHVTDGDRVDLGAATLPALVRTAIAERVAPVVRLVDLPTDRSSWTEALRIELSDMDTSGVVAHRAGRRWTQKLRPVAVGDTESAPPRLVNGGRYLVTGGLGGIGYELVDYLVGAYQARVLLVGRTPLREDDERAQRLADLRGDGDGDTGVDVEYVAVDVADAAALAAAVAAAEQRWGHSLDGVLHAAGADVIAYWTNLEQHTLSNETEQSFQDMFHAKVFGTLAIRDLLADRPQTALVLFSSVNGDLGGSSFGAYSAANGFLSGFADHWHHSLGREVHCLAWSMWTDVGMNRSGSAVAARSRGFRSISVTAGLASFLAAMSVPEHHLLIGLDIDNPHIVAELAADGLTVAEVVVAYASAEEISAETFRVAMSELTKQCPVPVRFHRLSALPRGADGSVDTARVLTDTAASASRRRYVEPANDLERQLSTLWTEVLNRPRIGRDDSFFELGGDSVRAVQLVTRINGAFAADLAVHQLYERPTVGQLALAFGDPDGRQQ